MAKEFQTIFSRLSNVFSNAGGKGGQPAATDVRPGEREILHASSQEEMKAKTLQLQQDRAIKAQYTRQVKSEGDKRLMYEASRQSQYMDYQRMEYYPIISAALDLVSEEATTIGQDGKMLKIYSSNKRVKAVLEDLFYNVLDLNSTLHFWCRNLPVKHDSMIPLLDGTQLTIKEIAEQIKSNPEKEFWTYSVQDGTQNIVPGKIVWCGLTRKDEEIYRVHLDDESFIETSGDHEFLLRKGGTKKAMDLVAGDSLMPFYTKISKKGKDRMGGYEKVYNPKTEHYKFTHSIVSHALLRNLDAEKETGFIYDTHHKDFNKLNNHPSNLQRIDRDNHFKLHQEIAIKNLHTPEVTAKRLAGIAKYLRSESRRERMSKEMTGNYSPYFETYNNSDLHAEHNIIRRYAMSSHWQDEEYKKSTREKMSLKLSDNCKAILEKVIKNNSFLSRNKLCNVLLSMDGFITSIKAANTHIKRDVIKSINTTTIENLIQRYYNCNYHNLVEKLNPSIAQEKAFINGKNISEGKIKSKQKDNHKVLAVEIMSDKHDVYCMEVQGPNGEHDRHNFPICGRKLDGSYDLNGSFVANCKYGDNFLYLLLDQNRGVIGAKQLANIEVERVEEIIDDKLVVKFKYKNGGVDEEFTTWQIAHFRLLGDDRRMPYGMSILDKVRRTFKMLTLFEDSMMVYRITRAAERRIFKVDVGDMPEEDVDQFIQQVARSSKSTKLVDPETGDFNWKYSVATNDQDYFVPVRNASASSPIETLPGASNLNDIADITYLRDNLYTGLGIPKAFLGFSEDSGGEGKALSMLDIRFARKVNKIQQSLIAELNKIAMIHLYILGGDYREHLDDFTLTLANPSTASHMLKIETQTAMFTAYESATRISENGTKAWSEIRAKKEILGMSEEEIMDDLQEQMIEAKIGDEIKASGQLIRSSGLFDKLIKYKNAGFLSPSTNPEDAEGGAAGQDAGGDPMAMGGGEDPMGADGGEADPLAAMDAEAGGGGPVPPPMNEAPTKKSNRGKELSKGLIKILKETDLSNDLDYLMANKQSAIISENRKMELTIERLIKEIEERNKAT